MQHYYQGGQKTVQRKNLTLYFPSPSLIRACNKILLYKPESMNVCLSRVTANALLCLLLFALYKKKKRYFFRKIQFIYIYIYVCVSYLTGEFYNCYCLLNAWIPTPSNGEPSCTRRSAGLMMTIQMIIQSRPETGNFLSYRSILII